MLDPLEMEAYIQAIAARADMRVKWEREVEQPCTDGRTIWLPYITSGMTPEKYSTLKHYVVHEVDHVRFTDFEVGKNEPSCKEGIYGACLNMVEDLRVEKKGSEEYLGDRLNSGMVQSARIAEIGKSIPRRINTPGEDGNMLKTAAPLLNWSHKHWSNMYPAVAGSAASFLDGCLSHPDATKYMERFDKGTYDAELKTLESTADAIKLAERIAREVYEVDPDEERRKAHENRKQQAKDKAEQEKGEGEEGEGGEDGEGEGKDKEGKEGEKGKSKAGKKGKGKGKPRDQEVTVDYSSVMPDPHESNGPTRHAMHIKYSEEHFSSGTYSPAKADDYKVWQRGAPSDGSEERWSRRSAATYFAEMKIALRHTNPNFAQKVRIILQVRAKDRVQYGLRRGHLNQGSLHRLAVDNPHYAERVFKRKITSDVMDTCVFLLVDQSGSMGGSKFVHAAVAAAMMNEVIGNVLHIPTFVASFTDFGMSPTGNGERCNIFVHREWKDQLLNNDRLMQSFADGANKGMGNNSDGDAVMWAYHKIANQKQKRKLIIVFSDGSPAGGGRGDVPWYTKKVVKGIEKETPVNIVGIGLQDNNVKYIYKDSHVIHDVSRLEEALLSTIERKLK
jgi:cobalamin biosynthesis protein CobT